MTRTWKILGALLLIGVMLIATGIVLAGCSTHSSGAYKAKASAIATSTAAQADKARAQAILKPCIATGHIATAKACLEKAVPPAQRQALATCLAEASLKGMHSLEAVGAQACLVKVGA